MHVQSRDERPVPRLAPDTAFFWHAGADGVLRVLGCGGCDRLVHPPAPRCRRCGSTALAPRDLSGRATVWSWTEVHQPFVTWLEVPYVVGIVALAEDGDVHLTTRLVDLDAGVIEIGMPVAVRFEQVGHAWLPLFGPLEAERIGRPAQPTSPRLAAERRLNSGASGSTASQPETRRSYPLSLLRGGRR